MPDYHMKAKLELEKYWSRKLSNLEPLENQKKKKMYILSMFPYPSGQLHLGHMRVYTTADVLARYNRFLNKDVIFPMGWDSFGLPAENAAFSRGYEPRQWTNKNIKEMRQQLQQQMCLSIDWSLEISTCDPGYFRWTQWLFCRLFEAGLAYQRSEIVNWDPVDRTVLADELVDKHGRSWRSGATVEKIALKQWFVRTTALSRSLLDGLATVSDGQWRHVAQEQRGWLGRLEGVQMEFDLVDMSGGGFGKGFVGERLSVFTTNAAAALSGCVAFIEINRDNIWWNSGDSASDQLKPVEKPSFHSNLAVKHPLSGKLIPIIRNPHLQFNPEECLSARLGLPLIDFNDAKLAAKLNIPFCSVSMGAYNCIRGSAWPPSEGMSLDSNFETLMNEKSMQTLRDLRRGGYECSKLRTDWLISRQRYWGTPIPIVHCPNCGPVLVEDHQLPVELPSYSLCQSDEPIVNDATSPLAKARDWMKTDCPKCANTEANRETDTMDTFVDSSWYFLRHLDSRNCSQLCSPETAKAAMPVDIYIGGMEHAIRHLFYARFVAHFIHYYTDIQLPNGPEPFAQFLPIGLVLGQTFATNTGKFVPLDNVEYRDNKPFTIDTAEELIEYWDKMSKSKYNGVNPKSIVDKYGMDLTRLIMMSNTGPDKVRKWQENDIVTGAQAWDKRIWKLVKTIVDGPPIMGIDEFSQEDFLAKNNVFVKDYQSIIDHIQHHYESTFTISVVVAYLQKLTAILTKLSNNADHRRSIMYYRVLLNFLIYLHPLSPLLTSELWAHTTAFLLPAESVFIETDSIYAPLVGQWSCDLRSPIWNQGIHEKSGGIVDSINESSDAVTC